MNTRRALYFFVEIIAMVFFQNTTVAQSREGATSAGFKLIGEFEMVSNLKVENGVSLPLIISPLIYQVYSDGIDVRIYCEGLTDENFTTYEIYRSDGIGMTNSVGEIDYIAGVQASSLQGDMIRQISLTRDNLVMVKIPSRSHRVIVSHSRAVKKEPSD